MTATATPTLAERLHAIPEVEQLAQKACAQLIVAAFTLTGEGKGELGDDLAHAGNLFLDALGVVDPAPEPKYVSHNTDTRPLYQQLSETSVERVVQKVVVSLQTLTLAIQVAPHIEDADERQQLAQDFLDAVNVMGGALGLPFEDDENVDVEHPNTQPHPLSKLFKADEA